MIKLFGFVYPFIRKADLSLPTVIDGTTSPPPGPGYYIVEITDGHNFGRVGGFSVMHMEPAPYVSISCMSADALNIIVENYQTPERLKLVYGPVDFTGDGIQGAPRPFTPIQIYVNLPVA